MAPLSTTTISGLLKAGKFKEMCESVEMFFNDNPDDNGSAVKVVKTVAWFVYENSVDDKWRKRVVETVILSVEILCRIEKSSSVFKDVLRSLYYIVSRLEKVDKDPFLLSDLLPSILRLCEVAPDKTGLLSVTYNLYVTLWNFVINLEPSLKTEAEIVACIQIQNSALLFQLMEPSNEKFSFPKLINKMKTITTKLASRIQETQPLHLLADNLIKHLLNPNLKQCDETLYLELWTFSLEFCFKTNNFEKIKDLMVARHPSSKEQYPAKEIDFLIDLKSLADVSPQDFKLKTNIDFCESSLSDSYLVIVINIFMQFYNEISEKLVKLNTLNPGMFDLVETGLVGLCSSCTSPESIISSCKLLSLLENLEIINGQDNIESRVQNIRNLFDVHEELVRRAEEHKVDESSRKSIVSKLAANTYTFGSQLYQSKMFNEAEEFLLRSCSASTKLLKIEPSSFLSQNRTRWKSLADVQNRLLKKKDYLVSLAVSLVFLVSSDIPSDQIQIQLCQYIRGWNLGRVEWIKQDPDNTEAKGSNIIDLIRSSMIGDTVSNQILSRLLTWEILCYRQLFPEGPDLRELIVESLNVILELDQTSLNIVLVFLEQTWIFCFHKNLEDLETGIKLCEKAKNMLTDIKGIGVLYLSITQYLRFLCEHKVLQIQIACEMKEEEERRVETAENVENIETLGMEESTEDARATYVGLEIQVQDKLVILLEEAEQLFMQYDYSDVGYWYTLKNLLDLQLAVASQLELFNSNSSKLLEHILALAERFDETEYIILAGTRLIQCNPRLYLVHLDKICELSKSIEDQRSNTPLIYDISLTLAESFLNTNRYPECESILDSVLENSYIRQNSLKPNLVSAEARYLGSRLRYMSGTPCKLSDNATYTINYVPISHLGPVELAVEAFKVTILCWKYLLDDLGVHSRQEFSQLWLEPKILSLLFKIIKLLNTLYKVISTPREMRGIIKEGLTFAQSRCLPLQSAVFLVELAKVMLLCDEHEDAFTQLQGVKGVLEGVLHQGEKGKVYRLDMDEEIVKVPGDTTSRAASPLLFRNTILPPDYLEDSSECCCSRCSCPILHLLVLDYFSSQARALMLHGELRAGKSVFRTLHEIIPKLRKKVKLSSVNSGLDVETALRIFEEHHLECLILEADVLAFCGELEDAQSVLDSIQLPGDKPVLRTEHNHIETVSVCSRLNRFHPSLVFKILEIKASLSSAIQSGDLDKLINATSLLSITNRFNKFEGHLTPTVTKTCAKSSKAPRKRDLPSLGPQGTNGLAKDLEKLNLYSSPYPSNSPELKPRHLGQSRLRLMKIDDLLESEELIEKSHGKPKIVVTANTPNKFFKSKGAVGSEQTPIKLASKVPKRVSKKVLSPTENKSVKKSTKKSTYQIYEDMENSECEQLNTKTPVRSRAVRSTRKKNLETENTKEKLDASTSRTSRSAAKRL